MQKVAGALFFLAGGVILLGITLAEIFDRSMKLAGIIGLLVILVVMRSSAYKSLSAKYQK